MRVWVCKDSAGGFGERVTGKHPLTYLQEKDCDLLSNCIFDLLTNNVRTNDLAGL